MKTHDKMGPLWDVHFPLLPLESTLKSFPWTAEFVHGTTSIDSKPLTKPHVLLLISHLCGSAT